MTETDTETALRAHKAEVQRWLTADTVRITVKPSERAVVDDDGKQITVERYAAEDDIIQALRDKAPDTVQERIYFFPQGFYTFITDKGEPYNIRQVDRPLTADEREQIDSLRYEIKVRKDHLITDEDKETYKRLRDDYAKQIKAIHLRAASEGDFIIKPLKKGKQIRLYISSYYTKKVESLGYKVIEQERETTERRWDDSRMTYYTEDTVRLSYSFVMNYNAFMSACKCGVIPNKGYYIDEQGESVKIAQSGVSEQITVRDADGFIREYKSKAAAAKDLGVSPSLLSKLIKATPEGQAVTISKGTKDNRKGVSLIRPDGELLEFESVTEAARELGYNKMKISRAIKGKVSGDTVKLGEVTYTLS